MQRVRCYLLGERAVVLELEPPVSLPIQQRVWGLCQRLQQNKQVLEAIPGMNNLHCCDEFFKRADPFFNSHNQLYGV